MSWFRDHYSPLEGYIIREVSLSPPDGEGQEWPRLLLTRPGEQDIMVEVSQDPEGNGPGHLFYGPPERV